MNIRKILKWTGITLLVLVLSLVGFGYWFIGLVKSDRPTPDISKTQLTDLPYLVEDSIPVRGKILAVVTSTSKMGDSGKDTGYEMTELSRAYYVFNANGYEVDVASPLGGEPPVIIDDDDVGPYDFAFLNDPVARQKVRNTIPLSEVVFDDYSGVYFVGGKGAMFDFPGNPVIESLVKEYHESNKVIGAVCHGPAALVSVKLSDGSPLIKDKKVCSFTNEEELFLTSDAREIFPFLLQEELKDNGADFKEGIMYMENVVRDGNLVTGQNPWSTWTLAEEMIRILGHTPKVREKTTEELSIAVLATYQNLGFEAAKDFIDASLTKKEAFSRQLIAVHSITSIMQGEITRSVDLIGLLKYLKSKER